MQRPMTNDNSPYISIPNPTEGANIGIADNSVTPSTSAFIHGSDGTYIDGGVWKG